MPKKAKSDRPVNFVALDARIGKNVRIWHFTYVGSRTVIGDNVKIGSLTHIDYDVRVGAGTKIEGSVYVPPKSVIGKNVFIGPGAVLTNDPYPPSKKRSGVVIEDGAVIGGGAVIRAGVKVGKNSVVAMGAIVTKDVPPGKLVMGVPARVVYSRSEYEQKRKMWQAD